MNNNFFMKRAVELAKKGRGLVNPNPMVGCVIVLHNNIIGQGYHKKFGGFHAEVEAINDAIKNGYENKLNEAVLYVTLEPCFHYGKTPPCVDLIIKHRLKKVVIAMEDPNPLVGGRSIKKLEEYGIEVEVDILKEEAKKLNKFFINYIEKNRPYMILKSAMTLDGKIATASGDSKWVSGLESRKHVHEIRNEVMGILTSSSTVLNDNPSFDVRHVEKIKDPVPIILDRELKLTKDLNVFQNHEKVIVFTSDKIKEVPEFYSDKALIIKVKENEEGLDTISVIEELGKMKFDSLLIECGGKLAWSFVKNDFIDEYNIFIAPKILGGENSATVIDGNGFNLMKDSIQLKDMRTLCIGEDVLIKASSRK